MAVLLPALAADRKTFVVDRHVSLEYRRQSDDGTQYWRFFFSLLTATGHQKAHKYSSVLPETVHL
jgi:hypothetical protein